MNKKYFKYINTLFIIAPMTFAMSLIAIVRNNNFENDWIITFFKTWLMMLPLAYLLAFVILPIARKITDKIIKS